MAHGGDVGPSYQLADILVEVVGSSLILKEFGGRGRERE